MIKNIINFALFFLSIACSYIAYTKLEGIYQLVLIFISGTILGIVLMNIRIFVKDNKINSYKRELEKEAISSDENAAKVKVLESKIQVLEKALENALKK